MQIAIISTALAIVLFLCTFLGYREGIRLGMTTAKGIIPEPIKNPVQAVREIKQHIDESKEAKEEADEIAAMMAYNGDAPKGAK
jgi:hypothetical protein